MALRTDRAGAGPRLFPPDVRAEVIADVRAEVIAMACELPAKRGVPLSRWSSDELAREAVKPRDCTRIRPGRDRAATQGDATRRGMADDRRRG